MLTLPVTVADNLREMERELIFHTLHTAAWMKYGTHSPDFWPMAHDKLYVYIPYRLLLLPAVCNKVTLFQDVNLIWPTSYFNLL